ncbi:MAG: hypothetical protein VKK04_05360 [Synechococcales bacterium]|nr:hypothetical protein [Synechococcales bacterium]
MKRPTVEAINRRLKEARCPVRVLQRGGALTLRAALPPKPGSGRSNTCSAQASQRHRQEISLWVPASIEGLKRIEVEAQKLGFLTTTGQFGWNDYLVEKGMAPQTVGDWVEAFKQHYTSTHELTARTWEKHWQVVYSPTG